MVAESEGFYVSQGQFHSWLARMLCQRHPTFVRPDRDYWVTKTDIVFPVARPEATAGGISVTTASGTYLAYDRAYALDVLNHVATLYMLDARFHPGDVFSGEPAVKLIRNEEH